MKSTNMLVSPNRPLVLLFGWLGSESRNLNRYATIYRHLGWNVLIKIPPTRIVMLTATSPLDEITIRDFSKMSQTVNRTHRLSASTETCMTMSDLAICTIREVSSIECSAIIVHIFSNGGCFLWEAMCQILDNAVTFSLYETRPTGISSSTNGGEKSGASELTQHHHKLLHLRQRLIGLIFDSSPASYSDHLNRFENAMQFTPWIERLKFQFYLLRRRISLGDKEDVRMRSERALTFWTNMKEWRSPLPQLYIYSDVDHLTDSKELESLIDYRKSLFGKDIIWSLRFHDSPHCSHILYHPEEYKQKVESFLGLCCRRVPFPIHATTHLPSLHSRL